MNIYLAGRYSRRLELCGYREELRAMDHTVDAVWLNGEHQISDTGEPIGEHGELLVEAMPVNGREAFYANASDRAEQLRLKFAEDDFADVQTCDMLIAFTEEPRNGGRNRGGRHVEMGIALALGKIVKIVGPRENLFCWLPEIDQYDTWERCRAAIALAKGEEKPL